MDLIRVAKNNRFLFDAVRRPPFLYAAVRDALVRLEDAPLAERQAFITRRARAILRHAAATAYGRRVGAGNELAAWPILDKDTVLSDPSAFVTRSAWLASHGQTSGTTGRPLAVQRSLPSLIVEQVAWDLVVARHGLDPRAMRTAVLRGDAVKVTGERPARFSRPSQGSRWLLFSSNHLSSATVEAFVAELREFAPDCLFAYPGSLRSLCALMERAGLTLPIRLALTSSEVLDQATIDLARRVLGCASADYYGQAERVAFAHAHDGGGYRFLPGYGLIELERVGEVDEGDLYGIIGTGLWNASMPLVRYRTGDAIVVPRGTGEAELEEIRYGLRRFPRILGRKDGVIRSSDGAEITAAGITRVMYDVEHVYQWQVVQESADEVRIVIVPTGDFDERDRARLLENARVLLPPRIRLRIDLSDRLERTIAGKTPFVIIRNPAA